MVKLLGIDYGSKRIGLATCDLSLGIAFPLTVLTNSEEIIDEIVDICKKESIEKVVLGESKNFQGIDNPIMKDIQFFKVELEKRGLEVILHPEFMTSSQAERLQGKNNMLDASAATIILQSYVDKTK